MYMVLIHSNVVKKWKWNGNSVDPDQTVPSEQSDLGLHFCPDLSKYLG